jgi:hypothetical protein
LAGELLSFLSAVALHPLFGHIAECVFMLILTRCLRKGRRAAAWVVAIVLPLFGWIAGWIEMPGMVGYIAASALFIALFRRGTIVEGVKGVLVMVLTLAVSLFLTALFQKEYSFFRAVLYSLVRRIGTALSLLIGFFAASTKAPLKD